MKDKVSDDDLDVIRIITLANGWDNPSWDERGLHKRSRQNVYRLVRLVDLSMKLEGVEVVAGLQPQLLERRVAVSAWLLG